MRPSFKTCVKTTALLLVSTMAIGAYAQNDSITYSVGADVVSSYIWRGVPQEATKGTPNIQPFASLTTGSLTVGFWGSGSFIGNIKEVDIYATYAINKLFSVTLTDYNWNFSKKYFSYGSGTDHVFEATVSYAGVESLPLSASLNTMFYGADKKTNGDQAYSTYLELGYPVSESAKVFAGASLMESVAYGTTGFGVTNLGIKVSKSLALTDSFSLPVYGIAGFNPTRNDAFLVAGITF
jgi:hypothetical protein